MTDPHLDTIDAVPLGYVQPPAEATPFPRLARPIDVQALRLAALTGSPYPTPTIV